MPLEIKLLVWSTALAAAQTVIALLGTISQIGMPRAVGNRQDAAALTGWADRAHRAHRNLLESLVLFAILVLAAQATGKLSPMTALGAEIFFYARIAYALVYIAGIPVLRTLIWTISVVGLVTIFLRLV
jgi:uncharacterized MAPEG superfamily protein